MLALRDPIAYVNRMNAPIKGTVLFVFPFFFIYFFMLLSSNIFSNKNILTFLLMSFIRLYTCICDDIFEEFFIKWALISDIADALVNPIEYRKKMEKRDQLLKEMFDDDFQQQQKKELAKSESDVCNLLQNSLIAVTTIFIC